MGGGGKQGQTKHQPPSPPNKKWLSGGFKSTGTTKKRKQEGEGNNGDRLLARLQFWQLQRDALLEPASRLGLCREGRKGANPREAQISPPASHPDLCGFCSPCCHLFFRLFFFFFIYHGEERSEEENKVTPRGVKIVGDQHHHRHHQLLLLRPPTSTIHRETREAQGSGSEKGARRGSRPFRGVMDVGAFTSGQIRAQRELTSGRHLQLSPCLAPGLTLSVCSFWWDNFQCREFQYNVEMDTDTLCLSLSPPAWLLLLLLVAVLGVFHPCHLPSPWSGHGVTRGHQLLFFFLLLLVLFLLLLPCQCGEACAELQSPPRRRPLEKAILFYQVLS